jgi:flagella basal body P-ring formation protein FlgA
VTAVHLSRRCFAGLAALAAVAACSSRAAAQVPALREPGDAIRAAVQARIGASAVVDVSDLQTLGEPGGPVGARPDPAAMLGRPLRFSLVRPGALPVTAVARVTVVVEHTRARRAIARGEVLAEGDIETITGAVSGVPLRPLPLAADLVGGRLLRPLSAGAIVQANFVAIRRAVEPGDRVTVVAAIGDVEVSATFVAADGGRPGDVIRVVNPDTKRYVRGRIVRAGLVEVLYGR